MVGFKSIALDGRARVGELSCRHGKIATPVFLPVGTQASVKALAPQDLESCNVPAILTNTYHLYLRPGAGVVAKMGGLHRFMSWDGPIFTDSGGFQVFSLGFGIEHQVGKLVDLFAKDMVLGETVAVDPKELVVRTKFCKIEDDGPTFQSHLDGSVHFFPPEKSVEVQIKLGADFIVALDECTSPLHDYVYTKTSMERTHQWGIRSLDYFRNYRRSDLRKVRPFLKQGMFGVVQGGPFEDLRIESAKFVSVNDFFGVAIGGALVSSGKMVEILRWIYPKLDPTKPRHLLGIGTVPEIFAAVENGVDIFDSVHPTRIARMGFALSRGCRRFAYDLAKMEYRLGKGPLEAGCDCYTCQNFSRGYVHHLVRARELLAYRLVSIHNVRFMMRFMQEIREAITAKKLAKLKESWLNN